MKHKRISIILLIILVISIALNIAAYALSGQQNKVTASAIAFNRPEASVNKNIVLPGGEKNC
ncbi:MAG: hypothetical protein IJ043_00775 [Clostridia bacterium]|nr:hypothetical protein [Clostridia bacterium]